MSKALKWEQSVQLLTVMKDCSLIPKVVICD